MSYTTIYDLELTPKAPRKLPQQITKHTMDLWVKLGTITITDIGEENTYAVDTFGHEVYCKE